MENHTKGEWTLRLGAKDDRLAPIMVDSDKANMAICKVIRDDSRPLEEQQANALLISQAPALLQALKDCRQAMIDAKCFKADSLQIKSIDLQIEKATK